MCLSNSKCYFRSPPVYNMIANLYTVNINKRFRKVLFLKTCIKIKSNVLIFSKYNKSNIQLLPAEQLTPNVPGTHSHVYPLTRSKQVPPFLQGSVKHSLISEDSNGLKNIFFSQM
jgi:hypothetical protein